MTAKDLKNALLQEAVQGKLVPQIASEGNARDLLEKIHKEKAKLVKEGKLKKEKPLPEITEEEIPFDIPENWCWCRLGEIIDTNIGLTYSPSDIIQNGGTEVLRSNNIQNGRITYNDLVHVSKKVPEKCISKKGDLLICARNGSKALVGKSALIEKDGMAFGAFMAIIRSPNNPYILHFINSPVYRARLEGVNTTTINQITQDNLRETMFPLPPLAEQKRIVAAIEKFMPLIEEYGKKETELKAFNEQIGTLTKKAILQEAVQGKLVPQIAAEGNAKNLLEEIKKEKVKFLKEGKLKKEKPLPYITEDDIPFDIPENWCWCRLEEIVDLRSGNQYNETSSGTLYLKVADLNLQENLYEIKTSTRYTNSNDDSFIPQYSIIFPKRGGAIATNKKKLVLKEKVYVDSNTMGMTPKNKDLLPYLNMWFDSIDLGKLSSGTSVPQINNKDLLPLAFPLPPLAEQKRIVAAIEKILPLCEKLGE